MKSLRCYPATYSPISYEDVDITHLNYEEENAPKNYLEQIRYLLEEGNAGGYVSAFDRGFSGGLGRKVGGFINAVGSYPVDRAAEWLGYKNVPSFSDRYNEIVQQADAREQQLREEHPYAVMGAEMLGSAFGLGNAAYGIAGRYGLNGVTRMGSAGAIDAAVNTFGGAENLSDAITALPLNTIGGYAGGAVMGKLGEYGSKYGGQVLDWGQNKFRSNLNNRMQGILTDTSGHSINIPEIAARRQQIYDNFVFQNADQEVLDYVPIITRYKGGDDVAVAKSIRRNMVKENPNFQWRKDENGNYDYEHFIKDPTRAEYLRTLPSTYKNPDKIVPGMHNNEPREYLLKRYYNTENGQNVYDMNIKTNGALINKIAREGRKGQHEFEKVMRQAPQASEADLGLSQTGNAPSSTLRVNDNISPNKIIVNKKLPNVSNLYNELTAKTVYEKGRSSAGRQPTSLQNKNSAGRMRLSDLQTSPYYE